MYFLCWLSSVFACAGVASWCVEFVTRPAPKMLDKVQESMETIGNLLKSVESIHFGTGR